MPYAVEIAKTLVESQTFEDATRALRDCVAEFFRPTEAKDLPVLFDKLKERIGTKNDYLTQAEIDKALGDPAIKGSEAQALVALKQHFGRIAALNDDGKETADRITKADVAKAIGIKEISESMEATRKVVRDAKRTLYADDTKPTDSINHKAVVQAGIGNCYYFAALASLADLSPKSIADMITTNKDGTYTVTFPGKKPVTVKGPTDAELTLFPKPTNEGVWVHVMEKAYGELCMNDSLYRALRQLRGMKESVIPQEHTNGGSALDAGLRVLTNKSIGWTWSLSGPKALHEGLSDATTRGVPVTADTGFNVKVDGGPATDHVYSVLKYDKIDKVLTVRNPWGNSVPSLKGVKDKGDGVFEIPLETFGAYFTKISYPR